MGCECIVALPLLVRDRLLGVLIFALEAPHEFTLQERAALDSCANIFSFGIANAIAYEQEHRLHLLFEAVGNATLAIASEFELWPVLQNIVDEARPHRRRGVRGAGIVVAEDRAFAPFVFSGMTKEQESAIGRHPVPLGRWASLRLKVEPSGSQTFADTRPSAGSPTSIRLISFLAVPVRYKGRTWKSVPRKQAWRA